MKFILDTVIERLVELDQLPKHVSERHRFSAECAALGSETFLKRATPFLREYKGSSGPLISVSDLGLTKQRIVGIDLTGSEARPSGWCLLEDGKATTQRIGSDEDLIRLQWRPSQV
jgi:hypothetical protein